MATGARGDNAKDVYLFLRIVGVRCCKAHFTQISRLAVDRVAADHRGQLPVRVIEHAEYFDLAYPPIQVLHEALGPAVQPAHPGSRQLPTQGDDTGGGWRHAWPKASARYRPWIAILALP